MKKLLHKSCQWLVLLIAMLAVNVSASAETVRINCESQSPIGKTFGAVQVSGSGWTAQYISQYGILCMSSGTISFTSEKEITKISFDNGNIYAAEYSRATFETSDATLESVSNDKIAYTVSGKTSVTFSTGMYTNIRIIEVELADGGETPDPGTGGETPDPGTGGGTVTPDPGTGGGTTGAGSVLNFDFSAAGNGTLTQSPVTVTYSRSSDAGKSVASLSMFDNPLVFTSTGANIVKIEFTGKSLNLVNASLDGYNNPVWEGSAKSVSFTVNGGWSDYAIINTAVVTLEGTAPDPGTGGETPDPEVTKPSFPAEGVAYQLKVAGENLYLNLQNSTTAAAVLGNKAEAIYFTWNEANKGFTIKDADGNYAGVSSATGWNMGSTTPDYWTVEQDGNAYYLKNTTGKYLGCNNYEVGNAFFRDKAKSDADKFVITEYVEEQIEYTYFTIPEAAFVKDHDTTYDENHKEVPINFYFRVKANDVPGLDLFKYEPNGKQVTARLTADGATPRDTKLTIYGSYDGSQASIKSFSLDLEEKAFTITFPQGAFEADNGDVSGEFTYNYTPGVVRKTYTINLYDGYDAATPVAAPADVYVVYANAPEGAQYKNGSSYTTNGDASIDDFACPLKYWEIDREHSRVGESTIFLYLNRLPYTYHVSIEGCENATVTVKGEKYGNGAEFTSTDLLTESDVVFDNNVRGYTLQKQNYTAPAGDEDGYITAVYDELQYTYAKLNTGRTNPAPGSYSLDDREYGFQYFNVYFEETMSEDVSIAKADLAVAGITLRDAEGRDIEFGDNGVNAWADGQYFNFSAKEAITTPGTYTLHVPAGTFFFGEKQEMTNPELDLVWTLTAAQYYTVQSDGVKTLGDRMDPENEGSSLKNLRGFEITAPEGVTFQSVDDVKLYLAPERSGMYEEETDEADLVEATGYSISFGTSKKTILVSFDPVLTPAEPTSYSYIIPAGSIAANDGLTNKQISLSASVDPTVYFDLVVTYPAEGNAQAPVDHITVELPEGLEVKSVDRTNIYFNGPNATVDSWTQNGRELTITFADHAAQAGDYASYSIPSGAIIATDITAPAAVRMANSSVQQYNIPVTAAPVEYLVEFAGWPFETHAPQVTYNGQNYTAQQRITATDLTVEQLTATDADGYGYVITIDQPGYATSHGSGRVLVTYTAKEYAAVSRVSPAQGEISLDDAEGLGSITIFMDGEAGWDENVYCGDGNPVPAGVSMVGPNGAIELPWEGGAYGFCMWAGSNQINVNFDGTLKTPGQYTLIIPAGLNTIGGKENPRMEYTWTVKEATTFEFDRYYVQALGERNNDGVQLSLTGFTVALPENLSDCSTEVPGSVDLYITVSTGDEMSEEPAEPTLVSSTYSITDGVVTFTFPKAYTEKGRVSVTLNANNIGINGLSNKAFSTSFYVDPNPTQYIELASATAETKYTAFNEITEYSVTSSSDLWSGIVLDITAEMLANKTITVSYYTQEEGTVNLDATVESVSEANRVVTFKFTEPVTIPFDAWYSVIFPAGFITFDVDNIQSSTARFNNHKLVESYVYDVVYDETVPEGASLLQNGITIPVSKESFGGPVQVESADFTATTVAGKQPVVTVVQPTREAPVGTITLSYETIEPVPFNGQFTLNGTPSSLGNDRLSSITSITVPAPEGHTFASAEDCVLLFKGNIDSDYVTYESEATISEDGSEVTITLQPAYSTPGFGNQIALADGSLFLENGAEYIGFNCSFTLFPEYAFDIDHTDPADRAAIYNGDLDHIDVYLPAGLNVGYNTDFGIEVVGTDYVESFQPSYISNFGDFYRIQLPSSMDLPYGRITVTIPSDVFYYYDYENNDRYVTNAPYTLWIDNFSALQLVAEPAAGTVVGLDAIRVKGERGTLWNSDTNAETLAQSVHFSTYEGPVAVNTALENGVLVITPVETLTEGYYTLTIDGFAGTLESADVAASVNAPARFEFNVVGSTFAFQGAQPYDGKTISELTELETINLSFGWNVGNVRVSEQAGNDPILVTLTDGDGTEQTVIQTYPAVSENEWGGSVAQLVGKVQGVDFASTADGKYNVSLTIPAGLFVSDNGRTNEAMTLHYVYDSNKYFAVSPNFESWGHIAGPVKTFTLTAAEGVTFTGIASDEDVDRPTVYKNGALLTWANPAISADGKSVTLTLAEPISAESPNDQYYLVVPAGLFTGTVTTEEGLTFPATSTGIEAWREAFYVDAPAYEYAQINWGSEMQSGDSYAGTASNFQIHFGKSVYCSGEVPTKAILTDGQGTNYALTSMWSSDDYLFLSSDAISAPGHYTLILPAGAGWFSESEFTEEVRFEFNIVGSFAITDGTFTPADNERVTSLESFTYTLPEGKHVQSVDVTKVGRPEMGDDWQWYTTPFEGLTYEIAGEKNQVVFTFAQPFTEAGSVAIKFLDGAIVASDGSVSTTNPGPTTLTITVDPYPNDISRDGKEDVDDVNAIADIILQTTNAERYDDTKADQNGDHEVTIGDLVKYIEKLKAQAIPVSPEETDELGD